MEPEVTTAYDGGTAPEATPEGLPAEQLDGTEGAGAPSETQATQGEMLQADYTRKTQQIAQERQQIAAEREANAQAVALMRALQADPQGTLEWLSEQVSEALGQDNLSSTEYGNEPPEEMDPVAARLAQVEAFIAQQQQSAVEQRILTEVAQLQQRFGQFDADELFDHAVEIGTPNLEVALVHLRATKQAQQRQAAEAAALQGKRELPPTAGGSTAAGSAAAPKRSDAPRSIKEALNETLRESGLSAIPPIDF